MAEESQFSNLAYISYLLMTDDILGLLGHNRMGKTCAPKMFGFLRHPTVEVTVNNKEENT
jgi:hypothetical protein